ALVPVFSVLAPAARVAYGGDASALEPREEHGLERRLEGRAVRAIAAHPRGVRAVTREVLVVNDGQRHERAVGALRLDLGGDNIRKYNRRGRYNGCIRRSRGGGLERVEPR